MLNVPISHLQPFLHNRLKLNWFLPTRVTSGNVFPMSRLCVDVHSDTVSLNVSIFSAVSEGTLFKLISVSLTSYHVIFDLQGHFRSWIYNLYIFCSKNPVNLYKVCLIEGVNDEFVSKLRYLLYEQL